LPLKEQDDDKINYEEYGELNENNSSQLLNKKEEENLYEGENIFGVNKKPLVMEIDNFIHNSNEEEENVQNDMVVEENVDYGE